MTFSVKITHTLRSVVPGGAILLMVLFLSSTSEGSEHITTLRSVDLYPDHALVKESVSLTLNEGTNKKTLTHLPPDLQEEQIKATIEASNAVVVDFNFFQADKENWEDRYDVRQLKMELNDLQKEKSRLEKRMGHLNEEEEMVYANKQIQAGEGIFIEDLEDLATFYRVHLQDIAEEQERLQEDINETREAIADIESDLEESFNDWKKNSGRLEIFVDSPSRTPARIALAYLQKQAGWKPIYHFYDEFPENSLTIEKRAKGYQNTGYPWNDVEISLHEPLSKANDINPGQILNETLPTSEFPIDDKKSLFSGESLMFNLTERTVPGHYKIVAYPKMPDKSSFQFRAEVSSDLPSSGLNHLTLIRPEYTLRNHDQRELSKGVVDFGPERGVNIDQSRQHIETDSPFLSSDLRHEYRFTTTLKNTRDRDYPIKIRDRLPEFEDEDFELSVEFEGEKGNPSQTGEQLHWDLNLPANSEIEVHYILTIRHPEETDYEGLKTK